MCDLVCDDLIVSTWFSGLLTFCLLNFLHENVDCSSLAGTFAQSSGASNVATVDVLHTVYAAVCSMYVVVHVSHKLTSST